MSDILAGDSGNGPNGYAPATATNQCAGLYSAPASGYIHRLGARISNDSYATRLCLWNASSGVLLAQSGIFYPAAGPRPYPQIEADITPTYVPAGLPILIGFWAANGSAETALQGGSGSGTLYRKNQGNGGSLTSNSVAFEMNAYGYLTPVAAPNPPTPENYGVVVGTTPTLRLCVSTPDGTNVNSGVEFQVEGVSPYHARVNGIIAAGGPFASGTWVSYTINPADLGWTPAAGDSLKYGGSAATDGGRVWSTWDGTLTINSVQAPTITSPAAGPVIATPYLFGGSSPVVGCQIAWTFNDPQGEAQSAYQVKLYADSSGSKGTALSGADTGKVASVGGRTAVVTPSAGLTNKAYFWVGITTWDIHDVASTEAVVRTRMAWGRSDGRYDIGATPTSQALDHASTSRPANTTVVIEYTSTTGGTGQTGWTTDFSAIPLRRWLHWRAWLFGWASGSPSSPSLDELAFQVTSSANVVPDDWDLTQAASKASLDVSTYRYGSQSIKITCTGDSTTPYARQQIPVRPYTAYVLSGYIKALKLGGTFEAWVDIFDGANVRVASNKITATTSDFTQVVSLPYTTGAETSLWFRLMVTDGSGSAGSTAWFDAVEAQASTVVTAWQPGGVGKAVALDSGGIGIDGSAGGVARFHGTGTAGNDYVELGAHAWKFGGGPEIYSPDGVSLIVGGTSGATLPAQPGYGSFRPYFLTGTGKNAEVYYDGTQWLGPRQSWTHPIAGPIASTGLVAGAKWMILGVHNGNATSMFIEGILTSSNVPSGTNDANSYWMSELYGNRDDAVLTNDAQWGLGLGNGWNAGYPEGDPAYTAINKNLSQLDAWSGHITWVEMHVQTAGSTGTPGNLYVQYTVFWRPIYT
jgi:hypothetical protein